MLHSLPPVAFFMTADACWTIAHTCGGGGGVRQCQTAHSVLAANRCAHTTLSLLQTITHFISALAPKHSTHPTTLQ